jgi:hypothetical protein
VVPRSLDVLGRKPWGEAHVGGSAGHLRVLPPARRSSRAALQTATHPNRMAPGSMKWLAEQEKSDRTEAAAPTPLSLAAKVGQDVTPELTVAGGSRVRILLPPAESQERTGTHSGKFRSTLWFMWWKRRTRQCDDASASCSGSPPSASKPARCGTQHLQLSTPPHLPIHTADLPSRSYRTMARYRRSGMTRGASWLSICALDRVAVTKPGPSGGKRWRRYES